MKNIITHRRTSAQCEAQEQDSSQLNLSNFARKRQKPQIESIPGISPKQRDRYRVVLRGEILGDRLTLDEAIALAKGGKL
ncbi:MAG TPA: hypothetical protein V6D37_10065 [Candidatus Sericytochromatia bacterium]|jgi:hypothetical protein